MTLKFKKTFAPEEFCYTFPHESMTGALATKGMLLFFPLRHCA
jgi:hypothetical protein